MHQVFATMSVPKMSSRLTQSLLIVIDFDVCSLPFASWNVTLEHNVNLTVGATLHLREAEVRYDQAEQTCTTPNVTSLASQVTACRV